MILTAAGEVGVHAGFAEYKLRPSLAAMSSLGTPDEIVHLYASVMSGVEHPDKVNDAVQVIYACVEELDEKVMEIFGYCDTDPVGGGLRRHAPLAKEQDIIVIARSLLQHGITGDQEPLPPKGDDEPEYRSGFHAVEIVGMAVAHLGVSATEAWKMTMTEFIGATRSKFPPDIDKTGANAPTKQQAAATEEWFDQIANLRDN